MNMKYRIQFSFILLILFSVVSCDSFLDENEVSGKFTPEEVWKKPGFAEGVFLSAYRSLPSDFNLTDDYLTNDLVTNDLVANTREVAMGAWTERNNPLNVYSKAYQQMLQLNDFLAHVDQVDFAPLSEEPVKEAFREKLKAEAYGLRAWWGAELLKTVGGVAEDGRLLGYPIVTEVISDVNEASLPRSLYADCVAQILSDCDEALKTLPLRWEDTGDADQVRVTGIRNVNRINGLAVMALKARVLLRAASPAFAQSGYTWEQAVEAAAALMEANGGLSGLEPGDVTFYDKGYNEAELNTSKEILWYYNLRQQNKVREERNYPPSLFGSARVNPSQNLVNAFPDASGFPIDHSQSVYDDSNPYANRDPRLAAFVVYNGAKLGKATISTTATDDAIGATVNSTRTGYYLRKFINPTVDLTPGKIVQAPSYFVNARYTEVLLNFAEAANEVGGPDYEVKGYSARQVINAIRSRAGITDETYVNSLDQEGMRKLIHNERRIELCFEGFRFWDLCRWKDLDGLNADVLGFDSKTNSVIEVEPRVFDDYMIYPPIPNKERVLGLVQNKGWK